MWLKTLAQVGNCPPIIFNLLNLFIVKVHKSPEFVLSCVLSQNLHCVTSNSSLQQKRESTQVYLSLTVLLTRDESRKVYKSVVQCMLGCVNKESISPGACLSCGGEKRARKRGQASSLYTLSHNHNQPAGWASSTPPRVT